MNNPVLPGRYTARMEGSFVVFLIGMCVNRPLAVRKWMAIASAMPPMLKTLYEHPEKGFLAGESFMRFPPLTTLLLTYWRSFEDLQRFAHSQDDPHLAAWRRFNQLVGSDGTVGIWHETYQIAPGQYEVLYGNMPRFGLAAATAPIPATGHYQNARSRIASSLQKETV